MLPARNLALLIVSKGFLVQQFFFIEMAPFAGDTSVALRIARLSHYRFLWSSAVVYCIYSHGRFSESKTRSKREKVTYLLLAAVLAEQRVAFGNATHCTRRSFIFVYSIVVDL